MLKSKLLKSVEYWPRSCVFFATLFKGEFPVMAELTCILAANIPRQFFFVITTASSTRCLVEDFQLICYSIRSE